jgi:hypothetical protein
MEWSNLEGIGDKKMLVTVSLPRNFKRRDFIATVHVIAMKREGS